MNTSDQSQQCAVCAANIPPHSVEAERAVLGGLLLDNTGWDLVSDVLGETNFYRAEHRTIFQHISLLIEHNKPADALTVAESLDRGGKLVEVGGHDYIGALALNTPSADNIRRYAEIVRERWIMRKLAAVGTAIADSANSQTGKDTHRLINEAEARVIQIAEVCGSKSMHGFIKIDPLLTETVERIDMLYSRENKGDVTGLETGFVDLDYMTAGLQPGELTLIAAGPSMGKTALAMDILKHVAMNRKKDVAIFCMGMSGPKLGMRMIGSVGRVDQHQLRTGTFKEEDWPRLVDAVGRLNDAQIYIDDTTGLNALEVRSRARRLHRQCGGLNLIIVDYLQAMLTSAPDHEENKAAEIAGILRSLKALAIEIKVPVVALSQLNHSVDSRHDKRPTMSDLHASGAAAQDADLVLFIYRDEVYFPEKHDAKGKAEVIIGMQRGGPTGTVNLTFLEQYAVFEGQPRCPATPL